MEAILLVKEEEEEEEEEEPSMAVAEPLPRPMAGLYDTSPPPFLTKTFEMVEDPATDPVVSWSRARNSFVVWDSHKFSTTLLPRYFKHSNFSSFIRQLNTYGFRKVDPDRWEFANEGFLGGQKHLLKNIKRRRNIGQSSNQQEATVAASSLNLGRFEAVDTELEMLRRDRNALVMELVKLRQQQQSARAQILAMEDRLHCTERKQRQTMAFLARALKNPTFIQQLLLQGEQQRQLGSPGKRRRLPAGPGGELVTEGEMEAMLSSMGQTSCGIADVIWEELMSEGSVVAAGHGDSWEAELDAEEPVEWGEDVKDLVEQMVYLGSHH